MSKADISITPIRPPTAEERIRIDASRAEAYRELEGAITFASFMLE